MTYKYTISSSNIKINVNIVQIMVNLVEIQLDKSYYI